MIDLTSWLPLVAVAVPTGAIPLLYGLDDRPNTREAVTFAAAVGLLAVVGAATGPVLAGDRLVFEGVTFVFDVRFSLRADPFGTLFALLAAVLWLATSVYSVGYVRATETTEQTRYFAAFAGSLAATVGVAFAGNLLTLFLFYELLTVATYPLVTHTGTDEARAAGRTYLAYTLSGGVLLLGGIVLLYATTGTTAFVPGGIAALDTVDPTVARLAFGLMAVGFGVKTAFLPVHGWLPRAMVAPAPVSGLLHAVAVVKSGAFGLGRLVGYVFGPETVSTLGVGVPLGVAAATTAVLAGVIALRQSKIKRALAYSTVSQLSYIALGFAVGARLAVFGALLHLVAHAFMKITLFFAAGVIYVETGVEYLDGVAGLVRRLPATTAAFAVAAAGLTGLPLLAGFVSKLHLVIGAFLTGAVPFGVVYVVAGTLKLLLFWPIVSLMVFGDGPPVSTHEVAATAAGGSGTAEAERATTDGGAADDDGRGTDGAVDESGGSAPEDGAVGESGGSTPEDGAVGEDGVPTALDRWESRTPRTETRAALLGPTLFVVGVVVVFGVVPDWIPLFDLAEATVREVFGS